MSQAHRTESPASTVSYRARAERLYEQLFEDPALCPACFARMRTFYPEYDGAVAEHLAGKNNSAFSALGHRVDDEGGLMVNTATSDADPNTYREVIPGRVEGGSDTCVGWVEVEPPRPKTVCGDCGRIDYDLDEARGTQLRYRAIENLAEHVEEREGTFNLDAAKEVIKHAKHRGDLSGHDKTVLAGAIEFGLRKA